MNRYRGRPILRRTMLGLIKANWISLLLLAYGLAITMRLIRVQTDSVTASREMKSAMDEKSSTMSKLLDSKSREKLLGGLGLDYRPDSSTGRPFSGHGTLCLLVGVVFA